MLSLRWEYYYYSQNLEARRKIQGTGTCWQWWTWQWVLGQNRWGHSEDLDRTVEGIYRNGNKEVRCLCEVLGLEAIYFYGFCLLFCFVSFAISLYVKMWVFKCMVHTWRSEDSFLELVFLPPCFEAESLIFSVTALHFSRLVDLLASGLFCLLLLSSKNCGIAGVCLHIQLFTWFQWVTLKSSGLWVKCLYLFSLLLVAPEAIP